MAFKRTANPPAMNQHSISSFLGINISQNFSQLDPRRSPDMLNMIIDDKGVPTKRPGYSKKVEFGTGKINGMCYYRKTDGTIEKLASHSGKIYIFDDDGTKTILHTGVADSKIRSVKFNDKILFADGTYIYIYDGTTFQKLEDIAYIPTLAIGTPPTGGGTLFEEPNLLSSQNKQQFSGDGVSTLYQLIYTELESDTILVNVDGSDLVENTDFTVNRTNGTIDFSSGTSPHGAPSAIYPNNIEVTFTKTISGNKDIINKMTIFHVFGGSNDTKLFLSGNPNYKNRDHRSYVGDETYFPDVEYDEVGSSATAITGYATQYASQIVFKEDDIYIGNFEYENDEYVLIRRPINDNVGAISPDTIQIIDNKPVFINKKGVYQYAGGEVRDERNTFHISIFIDKNIESVIGIDGLLDSGNLEELATVDYDNKYFVFNSDNGIAWVYDYRYASENSIGEWFRFNNMYFSSVCEIDGSLYFGGTSGNIMKYEDKKGNVLYNDNGESVDAYWTSKLLNFDTYVYLKLINKIFYVLKRESRTSCVYSYKTETTGNEFVELDPVLISLFSYGETFTYGDYFSYEASVFPGGPIEKVRLKKVLFLQVRMRNNVLGEGFGILSHDIIYSIQRERR